MDYYTTFSDVGANNLFTFFVACVAGAKREGEGKGEGAKGKYRGKDKGPLPIFLPPNSLHLSTPATQAIFSIFLFFFREREGDGENNIIIKWIRSLKKAMYMYSNATT